MSYQVCSKWASSIGIVSHFADYMLFKIYNFFLSSGFNCSRSCRLFSSLQVFAHLLCFGMYDFKIPFTFFFFKLNVLFYYYFLQASIFLPVAVVLDEPDEMYIPWTQGMTAYFILYAL